MAKQELSKRGKQLIERAAKPSIELMQKDGAGRVLIEEDVISSIALLAAKEVDGVSLKKMPQVHRSNGLVKVVVAEGKVKVSMVLSLAYGYPIPTTCQQVQGKVKNTVETMTGLEVEDVSIRIQEVVM